MPQNRIALASIGVVLAGLALPTPAAAERCNFLMPIGGNGSGPTPHIVKKQVQRPKGLIGNAIGRTNWNTDFMVDQAFRALNPLLNDVRGGTISVSSNRHEELAAFCGGWRWHGQA